jgi:hypothetical protein
MAYTAVVETFFAKMAAASSMNTTEGWYSLAILNTLCSRPSTPSSPFLAVYLPAVFLGEMSKMHAYIVFRR